MAGGVQISPNLKKHRTRIDAHGNEMDLDTGIVGKIDEPQYVPTAQELASAQARTGGEQKITPEELARVNVVELPKQGGGNPLADMIKAQVQKALQETMKDIDIGKMVEDAVKDAFK